MIEINIKAALNVSVHLSEWDEGGAWIRLGSCNGSLYASLTREETEQLAHCLQSILAKEVKV